LLSPYFESASRCAGEKNFQAPFGWVDRHPVLAELADRPESQCRNVSRRLTGGRDFLEPSEWSR
jgi:hypothetical protein